MNPRRMLGIGIAVVGASLAAFAGTARAEIPPPVAGCGDGLILIYGPSFEAAVAAATQGHVNGDGWLCVNRAGFDNSNGHFDKFVLIDNNVPFRTS